MNRIILIGRLTRDPEVRYTQSGKANTNFSLAVDRFGSANKEADFIHIVAWDKLAETCGNYLHKGQKVAVEGRLQVRSYETPDGQKKRITEVVAQIVEFLEYKKDNAPVTDHGFGGEVVDDNDPIPF